MTARDSAQSAVALRLYLAGGLSKAEACRQAGVSRFTLYRHLARLPADQRMPKHEEKTL